MSGVRDKLLLNAQIAQIGRVAAAAPGQRPDARQKFAGGKGLRQIIVRPGIQSGHAILDLCSGRWRQAS